MTNANPGTRGHYRRRAMNKNCFEHRVRSFYEENPGEELTLQDIRDKFCVSDTLIHTVLGRLKRAGVLESAHVIRRCSTGSVKT